MYMQQTDSICYTFLTALRATFIVASRIAQGADHDVSVAQTMCSMRHRHVNDVMHDVRLNNGAMTRRTRLCADVNEVDAVTAERWQHQRVALPRRVVMATGAGVPA